MNAFYIPSGPKNLSSLGPAIDWHNVAEYNIEVLDSSEATVATSPMFSVACAPEKYVRVHFLNALGAFDAVTFLKPVIIHEPTSGQFQKSPGYPLQKTDTGIERFYVRANDTYEAKVFNYQEDQMEWLKELFDSPKAFLEWKGTEGQPDAYLPVTIIDSKFQNQKVEDEYRYTATLSFKLSNEYLSIRN